MIAPLLAAHDHDLSDLGPLAWGIVVAAAIGVIWVIWRAVVLTANPGEDDPAHIKRLILEENGETGTSDPAPTPGGEEN